MDCPEMDCSEMDCPEMDCAIIYYTLLNLFIGLWFLNMIYHNYMIISYYRLECRLTAVK